MMKAKELIEAYVSNPVEEIAGSNKTGIPSLSVRRENDGWALYSYETCISRRWTLRDRVAGSVQLIWIQSLKYTHTTSKYFSLLRVALSQSRDLRRNRCQSDLWDYEYHVDPLDPDRARIGYEERNNRQPDAGYAPGFGPSRGKNKVVTTFGQVHRPKKARLPSHLTILINRKGDF